MLQKGAAPDNWGVLCHLLRLGFYDLNNKIKFQMLLPFLSWYYLSFLAHLWGAYAIPVALSVVRCPSYVVCRLFGADAHHVPGLCLLGIGAAPYISHKIMAQKPNFHIFDFFFETTSRWCFILC